LEFCGIFDWYFLFFVVCLVAEFSFYATGLSAMISQAAAVADEGPALAEVSLLLSTAMNY